MLGQRHDKAVDLDFFCNPAQTVRSIFSIRFVKDNFQHAQQCDSESLTWLGKKIIDKIIPLLNSKTPQTINHAAHCKCLRPIQDDKYFVYQYSTNEELNDRAYPAFCEFLGKTPAGHSVYLERGTFLSIKKTTLNGLRKLLIGTQPCISRFLSSDLSLTKKTTGKRIHVSTSIFKLVSAATSEESIFQAAKTYILYMELMALAGNLDTPHVIQQKAIIQAFLMNLEFGRNKDESDHKKQTAWMLTTYQVKNLMTNPMSKNQTMWLTTFQTM